MNTLPTEHHIKVEAPRPDLAGTTDIVDGWPVHYVQMPAEVAVRYRHYSANYTRKSARPWRLGKSSYGTLENALRSRATQPSDAAGSAA